MACEHCGAINALESKFCRSCGKPLSNVASSVSRKKVRFVEPLYVGTALALLVALGVIGWGSTKAFAYYTASAAIRSATALQTSGDFQGSSHALDGITGITSSQQASLTSLKERNTRFAGYKQSYDKAVQEAQASTTDAFTAAQVDLQSIQSDYPNYAQVQAEMVVVQAGIVANLKNDVANGNQKISDNLQAANSARAASAQARREAAQAQSVASSASSQAETARVIEVEKSFVNQLLSIYNNYVNGCLTNASKAFDAESDGDTSSFGVYIGAASQACSQADSNAQSLNDSFTNLPDSYVTAGLQMHYAAYYAGQSIQDALDSDFDTATKEINYADYYQRQVSAFLGS